MSSNIIGSIITVSHSTGFKTFYLYTINGLDTLADDISLISNGDCFIYLLNGHYSSDKIIKVLRWFADNGYDVQIEQNNSNMSTAICSPLIIDVRNMVIRMYTGNNDEVYDYVINNNLYYYNLSPIIKLDINQLIHYLFETKFDDSCYQYGIDVGDSLDFKYTSIDKYELYKRGGYTFDHPDSTK